jgi:hypothetical protein
VAVDATAKLRAALAQYLDETDDEGLGASGQARGALSDAVYGCLYRATLTVAGRHRAVDGVAQALITKTGPRRLRIVGAVIVMSDGQGDSMHPLMADLSEEPPEAIIRLGGQERAIPYRSGGELKFVNVRDDDRWADVLRLSLA